MNAETTPLQLLEAINVTAPFNRWLGFDVVEAKAGEVAIRMHWREEAAQYSGFLHAGIVGALIDTACGFAAATVVGRVLASHYSVNCMAPAVGTSFLARGRLIKAGKRQVFTAAELFAETDGASRLVASGEAILIPISE